MAPLYGRQSALVVVDMLNDFVLEGAPLEVPAARDIIQNIATAVSQAKGAGSKVIYACDTHDPSDEEFGAWPRHCVRGTPGADVVEPLRGQHDILVEKTRYSPFFGTKLGHPQGPGRGHRRHRRHPY